LSKEFSFRTPEIKAEFDRMVADGFDPWLAHMHAHKDYPTIKTNATITRGIDTPTVFSQQLGCHIDTSDYRGHIKRICEERNLECEGVVEHRSEEKEPTPPVKLAVDLIDESISDELRMDPSKASLPRQELVEMVTEKYGSPHVK
jgi:hypothetical protein